MNIKNENLENVLSTGSGVLNLGSIHVEHTWDKEVSIKKTFSSYTRTFTFLMFLRNTCTHYKNMYFPWIMSLVWLCRVKYHFQGVSRPYWRCLGRFMRLFYHFTRFYGLKYTYRWQSRSSYLKSKYFTNDQNVHLMWSWLFRYHMQGVSRSYWGCLGRFMRLFYHFNRFYGLKYVYRW